MNHPPIHAVPNAGPDAGPEAVALDDLAAAIDQYKRATEKIKILEEFRDELRRRIQDALGDNETGTVAGRPVVRWTRVKSLRLDQTLLKHHAPPKLLSQCQIEQTTRRFTLVNGTGGERSSTRFMV